MAANTATSTTATVTGTDPTFKAVYKTNNPEGVVCMVQYTKGTTTSLTLTFEVINPSLSATDEYFITALKGTSLGADTFVITTAGNYRIPLSIFNSEKTIIGNAVFDSSAKDGVCVINFMEG